MGILLLLVVMVFCMVFASACAASGDDPASEPTESPLSDAEKALAMMDAQEAENTADDTEPSVSPDAEDNTAVDEGPVEWVTFTSEYGFTLQYPSNWVVVDDGVSYAVVLRPYDETQTTFYVDTHTKDFEDWTEADMVNAMIADVVRIRTSQEDVTFTEPESIEINGYPFVAQNYEVNTEEGVYHGECYYAGKGELGFEMYYSIQPDDYEALLPTLREIALSFTFVD